MRNSEQRQRLAGEAEGASTNAANSSLHVCRSLLALFLFLSISVGVLSMRRLGGMVAVAVVGGVTLTLEERRVTSPPLCFWAITANESYKCRMYNSELPAFPHANSIHYQTSGFIFNAVTPAFSLIHVLIFGATRFGLERILFPETGKTL